MSDKESKLLQTVLIVVGIALLVYLFLYKRQNEGYYRFYRPYYEWDYGCATGNVHGTMSDGSQGVCVRGGFLMPSFLYGVNEFPGNDGKYENITY